MPLYEYRCPDCGLEFESRVPMKDRDKVACTRCGTTATKRISLSSFRMVKPLYMLDSRGEVIAKEGNSSSSDERNLDIPPDYPNILEV